MAVGHIKLESPENTEEMVKEKLQRVNEPGEVVKCLFDPMIDCEQSLLKIEGLPL
jgi:hypothetical protein